MFGSLHPYASFCCCRGEDEDEQQRPQAPAGPPLVQYDLQELETAQQLLSAEIEAVRSAMGHSDVAPEDYYKAWQDTADEFVLDEQVSAGELYEHGCTHEVLTCVCHCKSHTCCTTDWFML